MYRCPKASVHRFFYEEICRTSDYAYGGCRSVGEGYLSAYTYG